MKQKMRKINYINYLTINYKCYFQDYRQMLKAQNFVIFINTKIISDKQYGFKTLNLQYKL